MGSASARSQVPSNPPGASLPANFGVTAHLTQAGQGEGGQAGPQEEQRLESDPRRGTPGRPGDEQGPGEEQGAQPEGAYEDP